MIQQYRVVSGRDGSESHFNTLGEAIEFCYISWEPARDYTIQIQHQLDGEWVNRYKVVIRKDLLTLWMC